MSMESEAWFTRSSGRRYESHSANNVKKPNGSMRIFVAILVGSLFGYFVGVSSPALLLTKLNIKSSFICGLGSNKMRVESMQQTVYDSLKNSSDIHNTTDPVKIRFPSNPRGAERLPPAIIESESDLFPRRLWGKPSEDLERKPKYLVAFTVGKNQKANVDAAVKKFSENFTIVLFHYDNRVTEWDEFEWSKRAIHVSAKKQTKWWYAKRFLHPDIVAPYEYIFIWDEDLGVEHFDAEEYIKLVKKHGLEISQPGLEPKRHLTWPITKRRVDTEVHKNTKEKLGWCSDPYQPPYAAFIEIMAPVFSRDSWRCVWHLIQNDLIHGWGLDFAFQKCVEPPHEKIGVVDAQWVVHQSIPSLGSQGHAENGKAPWQGVRDRCRREKTMFQTRLTNAENAYYKQLRIDLANITTH